MVDMLMDPAWLEQADRLFTEWLYRLAGVGDGVHIIDLIRDRWGVT